jgi:hypothetical protein
VKRDGIEKAALGNAHLTMQALTLQSGEFSAWKMGISVPPRRSCGVNAGGRFGQERAQLRRPDNPHMLAQAHQIFGTCEIPGWAASGHSGK